MDVEVPRGDEIYSALTPEEVGKPIIRKRAPGYSDLNFHEQRLHPGDGKRVKDPVYIERHTVLHDGKRQIYIASTWPEDSEDLQRAVDTVVESIEVN